MFINLTMPFKGSMMCKYNVGLSLAHILCMCLGGWMQGGALGGGLHVLFRLYLSKDPEHG